MCVNPIRLRNPCKTIALQGGQKLDLTVPCGQCVECVNNKRNEWYFRTYQQVQETLSKRGYIYFDTLTYSDEFIPKFSDYVDLEKYNLPDMTCFCREHFRDFLKRLRIYLNYHYGCNEFKYFLTSEYAVDPRYTRRPHYHILFFVTCNVDALSFSQAVSTCWKFGLTDGLPYKEKLHVLNHVYSKSLNSDFKLLTRACNYVAKYVNKNRRFNTSLSQRIDLIKKFVDDEEELNKLTREVDMFHAQSQGFGLYYLSSNKDRDIKAINNDLCVMFDSDKIVNVLPLPMYYKRKLYYVQKKRADGSLYWEKTQKGIDHDVAMISKRIKNETDRLYKDYTTFPSYCKEFIKDMLGSRTLEDLAVYLLYYRGRLRDIEHLPDEFINFRSYAYSLTDNEFDLLSWINFINQSSFYNSMNRNDVIEIDDISKEVLYNKKYYHYDTLIKTHCINEDTCPDFHDFDKIISIFHACKSYQGALIQSSFDYIEELKEKYKNEFL